MGGAAAFDGDGMAGDGSQSLSVGELEQLLAAEHGKVDGHVAQQLSEVELTERVSPARLAQWEKNFNGSKSREELTRLADSAAFLKVPVDDMVRDPAPDGDTQTKMFDLAVEYVRATMTRLPNFSANRETMHFEDAPSVEKVTTDAQDLPGHPMQQLSFSLGRSEVKPLHITATYSVTVTYRDGSEVQGSAGTARKQGASPTALTTYGEFGPMLGMVLQDAGRSQVTWSHWEQGESEPAAVFHYSVPASQSNYIEENPNGPKSEQAHPGYHGEIVIEPATGSILRLSAVADMAPPHQAIEAALLVEYASVPMGDRACVCPVHGVAYSKAPVQGAEQAAQNSAVMMQRELNDVMFTQYHLFGSEAHIVVDEMGPSGVNVSASPGHAGGVGVADASASPVAGGTPPTSGSHSAPPADASAPEH